MTTRRVVRICVSVASVASLVGAFIAPPPTTPRVAAAYGLLFASSDNSSSVTAAATEEAATASTTTQSSGSASLSFSAPLSTDEMIRQAASAMRQAASCGTTRQLVRILLPRDATSGDFGKYLEEAAADDDVFSETKLTPPDESWQGGIMQLYQAAAPTCQAIVRNLVTDASGVPPRITEDRSVDESGVDGVGLLTTDDQSVTCWVQPSQETVEDYICNSNSGKSATTADEGIVALVNPQWRQVDDVLDSASKGGGLFSGLASFLGGKGGVLKQLDQAGFVPVYTLEGYVCRGANVRLLQAYGEDWSVFCERDSGDSFVAVGTSSTRPTYQEVEAMLDESGIGFKYARDLQMQPKL